jgi:hypothetical protein
MARFRVLEVARAVADETNKLLGNRQLRLIHRSQLRNAAQSIPATFAKAWVENPDRIASRRIATHADQPKKRTNISERTLRMVALRLPSTANS